MRASARLRSARMGSVVQLPPRGHYLASEVGALAGVSGDQIGQWARYGYIRSSQSNEIPRVYSYQDVAEAMAIHQLRLNKISYEAIRAALEALRQDPQLGDWPLSQAEVGTAGASVVAIKGDRAFDLSGRPWHPLLDVSDLQRIATDLSRGGWAARVVPDLRHIEVNPERLSGQPTIRDRRVPVALVVELAGTIDGPDILREDYEIGPAETRDAVRWWDAAQRFEHSRVA